MIYGSNSGDRPDGANEPRAPYGDAGSTTRAEQQPASGTSSTDPGAGTHWRRVDGTGPAAFARLRDELDQLRDQYTLLWAARLDGIRLAARRAMIAAVLGLLGLLVVGTYLITATVLAIVGIGEGLGELFGGQPWLGHLVTGLALIGLLAGSIYLGLRGMTRGSRERTVRKYARQQYATERDQQVPRRRPDERTDAGQNVGS